MHSADMEEEEGRKKWRALVWSEMRRCCRTVGAEGRRGHCEAQDQVVARSMVEEEWDEIEGLPVVSVIVAAVESKDVESPWWSVFGKCLLGHSSA